VPYRDDVNMGRVIIGGSTVVALVLAVGFGAVAAAGPGLSTNVRSGAFCGSYPEGAPSGAAWFASYLLNDTARSVTVRSVQAADLHNVAVSHLSIAAHPKQDSLGFFVTDDPAMPSQYGRTVPVDSNAVVPAHGELIIVGRIRLTGNADAGRLNGVVVTTVGAFGTLHTVKNPVSYGIRVGHDHSLAEIGCTNT
jgi:hypothetical protein